MFYQVTYNDLLVKVRLYAGQKQAEVVQTFQTMSKVVGLAFGGKEEKDLPPEPKTKQELIQKFNALFSGSRPG